MRVRKTEVAWDPNLIRVEYLDDEGTPYYCCFEPREASPDAAAEAPAPSPAVSAGPTGAYRFGPFALLVTATVLAIVAVVAAALAAR